MKILNRWILMLTVICTGLLSSCENDGDMIYTAGGAEIALKGNTSDIVLSVESLDALALTLYWNENGSLTSSDPRVELPDGVIQNKIELSAKADFSTSVSVAMDNGEYEFQFTCGDLNAYLTKLGFEPGVKAPLYIRVNAQLAENMEPQYSETLVVQVTPYKIDTTVAHYLDKDKADTGIVLYSAEDNHVYSGFVGAGAWGNWWLREGDGTVWGNDGVSGTPFVLSSASTAWNFWYPGLSGCYYTVVNIPGNEWTALFIESLTVSGDVQGEMTYDRKANQWTLHVSGEAREANLIISGTGKQYNVASGTDDAAAVVAQVGFGGSASALSFNPVGAGSAISLTLPAGECDLILDLNHPRGWTLTTGTSTNPPAEEVNELLWVVGHNDAFPGGGWNFDSWLRLYNEDGLNYGGVLNIYSQWGYKLYKEEGNWDSFWSMVDGGTAFEGKLEANGETNIQAPEQGLYVMDVSLSGLNYKLVPVSSVSYSGLNDDWTLKAMSSTQTPGVYTAVVEKKAVSPYGVKIIINDNWDLAFGGGSGVLRLYQDGFDGDNALSNGTYTLTVNLCEGTYSYKQN